jgi:hypothetical protein
MGRVTGSDVVGGGLGGIDVEPFGRGRMHENYLIKIIQFNW